MPEVVNRTVPIPAAGALAEQHFRLCSSIAEELSLAIAFLGRDAADVQAGTVLTGIRYSFNRQLQEKAAACLRCLDSWARGEVPDLLDWTSALVRIEGARPEDAAAEAAERAAAQASEDAENNAAYEARQRAKKGQGHA